MAEKEWLSAEEFFADYDAQPEVRARRERLALARAVADAVIRYRIEHKLPQRALATALGMKPSVIARLELAEHNPSIETLERLASALGMRFVVDVAPASRRDQQAVPAGLKVVQDVTGQSGSRVLVAAG